MERLLLLVPAFLALLATAAGVMRAAVEPPDRRAVLGGLCFSVAVGVLAWTWRDPQVEDGAVVMGVLLAATFLGALPASGYFALGRALARRRVVLGVVFALSLAPLYVYCALMLVFVLEVVHCPADAYECPL